LEGSDLKAGVVANEGEKNKAVIRTKFPRVMENHNQNKGRKLEAMEQCAKTTKGNGPGKELGGGGKSTSKERERGM